MKVIFDGYSSIIQSGYDVSSWLIDRNIEIELRQVVSWLARLKPRHCRVSYHRTIISSATFTIEKSVLFSLTFPFQSVSKAP